MVRKPPIREVVNITLEMLVCKVCQQFTELIPILDFGFTILDWQTLNSDRVPAS